MAYTQTDLDAIDEAIRTFHLTGVAELQFEGQRTVFRSIEEILRMRAFVAGQLQGARAHRLAAARKGV